MIDFSRAMRILSLVAAAVSSCLGACRGLDLVEDGGTSQENVSSQSSPQPARRLRPNIPITRALAGAEAHEYTVDLDPDQALELVVQQQGIDVLIELFDPDGAVTLEIDHPLGRHGPEHVCFVSDQGGTHRLRIRPYTARPIGDYSILIEGIRAATHRDRSCAEGISAFAAAESGRLQNAQPPSALILQYERALTLWELAGRSYQQAIALKMIGRLWAQQGNLSKAIRSFEEALALFRSTGGERQEALVLNLLGLAQSRRGEIRQANVSFNTARVVAENAGDRGEEASAINNLALLKQSYGEVYEAIRLYQQSLQIFRSLGAQTDIATALHNIGTAYSSSGRFPEALDALDQAVEIRKQSEDLVARGMTWVSLGWVHHLYGDRDSVEYFERALELFRAAGDRPQEAAALDRLGSAYRKSGLFEPAHAAYRASLSIHARAGDRRNVAHTAANIGWLLVDEGRLDEARHPFEQARETLEALADRPALAHVLAGLAHVARGLGRLEESRHRIEAALELVDSLRRSAQRQGHRYGTPALWREYSEFYVDLLMELHDQEPGEQYDVTAFELSDLSRARDLYEMLLESQIDLRSGVDAELLARERALEHRIAATEQRRLRLLAEGSPSTAAREVGRTQRQLFLELEVAQAAIRISSPRFAELRQPSRVLLRDVQSVLDPDTLLLSYVLADERSFLFLLGSDTFRSYTLPGRQRLETLARAAYHGMRNSSQRRTQIQAPAVALKLGEILLEPVRQELGSHRLVVVGDAWLHYIPFAALPVPEPLDQETPELLLDRHPVVHLPSAAVIHALRQRAATRQRPLSRLAILADPVFSMHDPRVRRESREAPAKGSRPSESDYPRLVGSRDEAERIIDMLPAAQVLAAFDFGASTELVRSGSLKDFQILHFATHSILHEVHPELSGIVLSLVNEHGKPQDGFLRLHQIYTLELPADLVVLSSCRTALGQHVSGDGLYGLARGFFYAGASKVLVSLWEVDDQATAELMKRFYRGLLQEELSPAAALRTAQREMRNHEAWRTPYYWAGFVLQGDWR